MLGVEFTCCLLSLLCLLQSSISAISDNPAMYFPAADRDAMNVTWAHGVNSLAALDLVLADDIMMIETDIILRGMGTENQTNIPVHAHPPLTDSDLTLEHFMSVVAPRDDKGIKLDFKYLEAVAPSMQIIAQHQAELLVPLFLNADIVIGPNSPRDPVPPDSFIEAVNRYFNQATLSLGFTTSQGPEDRYTWTMIFDILSYTYPLHPQPVTFPVRAAWTTTTWHKYRWLLNLRESFSISVWSSTTDDVDMTGLVSLRSYGDDLRVFYDLPDDQMTAFQEALQDPSQKPEPLPAIQWSPAEWVTFENSEDKNFAFLSADGLGISGSAPRAAIVHSRVEHKPLSNNEEMTVSGQVQFVDRYDSDSHASVEIYIRSAGLLEDAERRDAVLSGQNMEDSSSIKVSINSSGVVHLQDTAFVELPAADCYNFDITDKHDGNVEVSIVVKTCLDAYEEDPNAELNLNSLPNIPHEPGQEYYVIVTKLGGGKDAVIHDLYVTESQGTPTLTPTPTGEGSRLFNGFWGSWMLLAASAAVGMVI